MAMPAMAAKLTYQIKGVRGAQKDNVEAYLNALPVYQERQYRPARAKITESVQKALQVYGYYQPKITLNRDKKAPAKVVIEIERGEPVIISRLDILRGVAPGESYQTLPFVRPGGEILLKIEGWPKVEAVLRHVDGIEAIGVDPAQVDPDHWRHVAHWMNAGEAPRPYTAERHQAWLRRREIAP